jgi:hypothetical protein
MTDPRLDIIAVPRVLPPDLDDSESLFWLVWETTRQWGETIKQLKQDQRSAVDQENRAWLVLAEVCFRLHRLQIQSGLPPASEQALSLIVRYIEQELAHNDIRLVAPVGAPYTAELSDLIENVDQVARADIQAPTLQDILAPAVLRGEHVISFGKAVIAFPESD